MLERTLIGLLFSIAVVSMAIGQEQPLKKKDVPKAVLEAFQNAYPNAAIKGFSKEVEKGKTLYEIESTEGITHRDISYNPDGSVVTLEETLPFTELPEGVRSTMKTEYPQAKVTRCEKLTEGQAIKYELAIQSGKRMSEVVFDATGKLVKREKK